MLHRALRAFQLANHLVFNLASRQSSVFEQQSRDNVTRWAFVCFQVTLPGATPTPSFNRQASKQQRTQLS
nr:hypothetical protein CFP56_64615 [Quercus suber]